MGERIQRVEATSEITRRADYILSALGLSWDELRGKLVLDVGAAEGALTAAARREGATVIGFDNKLDHDTPGEDMRVPGPYAIGDARHLPYKDNTFDYVLAHAAPPTTWVETKEDVLAFLREFLRVVKPGGEVRFGSGGSLLPLQVFHRGEGEYVDFEKETSDFLREQYPQVVIHKEPVSGQEYSRYRCVIRKPEQ